MVDGKSNILLDYQPTRSGDHAARFLGNYSGYVVCDGCDAYNKLKKAIRCGCWAHVRRKYMDVLPYASDTEHDLLDCTKRRQMENDLPERFGSYKTVYSRFCKWRDDGTLYRIFRKLNAKAELKELSIDSTSVKAHPQSAGAKKGL